MQFIKIEEIKKLLAIEDDVCISIYMPTDPVAADIEQQIRFKNLLRRAETTGRESCPQSKVLANMIEKGWMLLRNGDFWRRQSNGLAVFITSDDFWTYRLPLTFEETVSVSRRLTIKPLLPLFMADGRFFVLALSQSSVRLLACSRYHAVEVDLPDAPAGIADTLRYDEKQYQIQFHTGTASGSGQRPAMFHGQGVGIDDRKDDILRYFKDVDKGLPAIIAEPDAPLVLAGVDYLLPIFRKATAHPWVMSEAIIGNPDGMSANELQAKALPIVKATFEQKQREAESRYREQAGLGRTAAGIETVLPAAVYGRVETLFVAVDERCPGLFDRQANQVCRLEADNDAIEDLLDLAAAETIRNGGNVYAVRRDKMPEAHTSAVALLRY